MSLFGLRSPVLNPSDHPGPVVIQSLLCHHEISVFVFLFLNLRTSNYHQNQLCYVSITSILKCYDISVDSYHTNALSRAVGKR